MPTFSIKPLSIKIDQELRARIQNLAKTRRRTAHWLAKEAIVQFVDREEKREVFRQATLAAWEEYQQTGLHLTGEEVDAWMAKLENGEDAELPECHI